MCNEYSGNCHKRLTGHLLQTAYDSLISEYTVNKAKQANDKTGQLKN